MDLSTKPNYDLSKEVYQKEYTFIVHPGVGDLIFQYKKLCNLPKKFNLIVAPDNNLRRSKDFNKIFDKCKSLEYGDISNYRALDYKNRNNFSGTFEEIVNKNTVAENTVNITCNWHILDKRIETWCPDLPINYHPELVTSEEDKEYAKRLLKDVRNPLGIYTSSSQTNAAWTGWTEYEWCLLINYISFNMGQFTPVLLGSWWDKSLTDLVSDMLKFKGIEHINLVNKTTLSELIELLKLLKGNIGLSSGVGILAECLGLPTVMIYTYQYQFGVEFVRVNEFLTSWVDPLMLADGTYKGIIFDRVLANYTQIEPWLRKIQEKCD